MQHKTLVRFLIETEEQKELPQGEVFAYFPQVDYNKTLYGTGVKTCYSHIGQHSACNIDYARECKPATPEQYQSLLSELTQLGYNLRICQ